MSKDLFLDEQERKSAEEGHESFAEQEFNETISRVTPDNKAKLIAQNQAEIRKLEEKIGKRKQLGLAIQQMFVKSTRSEFEVEPLKP